MNCGFLLIVKLMTKYQVFSGKFPVCMLLMGITELLQLPGLGIIKKKKTQNTLDLRSITTSWRFFFQTINWKSLTTTAWSEI